MLALPSYRMLTPRYPETNVDERTIAVLKVKKDRAARWCNKWLLF
jgi:hypothetical protein